MRTVALALPLVHRTVGTEVSEGCEPLRMSITLLESGTDDRETLLHTSRGLVQRLAQLIAQSPAAAGTGGFRWEAGGALVSYAAQATTPDEVERTLQAHSILFHLLNIAEEAHAAKSRRRAGSPATGSDSGKEVAWSFRAVVRGLIERGATPQQIREFLGRFEIQPVLTAHPTEAKRVTVLEAHQRIYRSLLRLSDELTPDEQREEERRLEATLELLWQTGDIYLERPRVQDEVENGLFYFRQTFFPLVPAVISQLYHVLADELPGNRFDVPALLQFSSWRGGDRDGNPFVTAAVTRETLRRHADFVLECYIREIDTLIPALAQSIRRVAVSSELAASLEQQGGTPGWDEIVRRNPYEPYRQKLGDIRRRLQKRRECLKQQIPRSAWPAEAYRTAAELLADLGVMRRSLEENGAPRVAEIWLRPLEIRVKTFGLHLARLDLRENSEVLEHAMEEVCQTATGHSYGQRSETERRQWLLEEIASRRPLIAPWHTYSPATTEVIDTFRLVTWARSEIDEECLGSYIVSMTRDVSDLLVVYLLLKEVGAFDRGVCQLSVVPLFETVGDLQRAPEITEALFACAPVEARLATRGRMQQIMIGYSDSNKDGGLVAAAWQLYQAQDRLVRVAARHGSVLKFFHGTGGSISRGGGPADRTIFGLPPGTLVGRIKITEQGEVISSKYANPETASYQLQRLVGSVMAAGLENELAPTRVPAEFLDEMEVLARDADRAYRELIEDTSFVDYFRATTPIDVIGQLNLGSRPAKRKATLGVADLRAIPWVFSWTQNRHGISGWYGAGTALSAAAADPARLTRLRQMDQEWRFFGNLVRSLTAGALMADLEVASWYAELYEDRTARERIFQRVSAEHARTVAALRAVTGHETLESLVPNFALTSRLRFPALREIHRLQVRLLQRARSGAAQPDDQAQLLLTVNCLAAGLRNTG